MCTMSMYLTRMRPPGYPGEKASTAMPLRPLQLPGDLPVMLDLIERCFVYPENDAWSIQTDELESMADSFRTLKRLWPLLWVLRLFSRDIQDTMWGIIAEEDDKPVGMSVTVRQPGANQWVIGNVAVLPAYRRRGLAREMVLACVGRAQQRGGALVELEVVLGNLPASRLYERLGFTRYVIRHVLRREAGPPPERTALPDGYELEACHFNDWQPRHALAARITPASVQRYVPESESRYRRSRLMRLLYPLLRTMMRLEQQYLLVRGPDGQPVASAITTSRRQANQASELKLMVDPAAEAVTVPLVAHCLHVMTQVVPGQTIDAIIDDWQPHVVKALADAGFHERYGLEGMAMLLGEGDGGEHSRGGLIEG